MDSPLEVSPNKKYFQSLTFEQNKIKVLSHSKIKIDKIRLNCENVNVGCDRISPLQVQTGVLSTSPFPTSPWSEDFWLFFMLFTLVTGVLKSFSFSKLHTHGLNCKKNKSMLKLVNWSNWPDQKNVRWQKNIQWRISKDESLSKTIKTIRTSNSTISS